VQESVIAFRDILRTYGHSKHIDVSMVLAALVDNVENIDEADARASLIYIIGEYSPSISNASELLPTFLSGFKDEPNQVQLQLLTATVKLFLRKPAQLQDLVQRVLQTVTSESDNPDIRDRAYVYWRLLSSNPQISKVFDRSLLVFDPSNKVCYSFREAANGRDEQFASKDS
jgi:AP-1 complex subunit beta-1